MKRVKVLILNGGKALRMGGRSKCLTFVRGRTILEHQLNWLRSGGIKKSDVIVSVGSNKELVDVCHAQHLQYFEETQPLGDGGAVKRMLELNKPRKDFYLLVLNGDLLINFDLKMFLSESHRICQNKDVYGVIVVVPLQSHLGVLLLTEKSSTPCNIIKFVEKPTFTSLYSSCGIYLFDSTKIYKLMERSDYGDSFGLARELVMPNFDKFHAYCISHSQWLAVETEKDVLAAQELVKAWDIQRNLRTFVKHLIGGK